MSFFFIDMEANDATEHQLLNERVAQLSFGVSLTTAALALKLDYITNRENEYKFQMSGLKQSGRPAVGVAAQCAAGRSVLETVLNTSFSANERPVISVVHLARGFHSPPSFVFAFGSPDIAKSVRQRLLSISRVTPVLENIFIEPVLTRATLVRVQILRAIRQALMSRDVVSRVKRFDRSPTLIVTHDQRDRFYDFVEACKEFRSLLNADLLRYAYAAASREFTDCLASVFIVLSDGGQPVVSFRAPTASQAPAVSGDVGLSVPPVVTVAVGAAARRGFLLESLSSGSSSPGPSRDPRKRPADSVIEALSFKRASSAAAIP